jgi:hypothetical protein
MWGESNVAPRHARWQSLLDKSVIGARLGHGSGNPRDKAFDPSLGKTRPFYAWESSHLLAAVIESHPPERFAAGGEA